MLGSIFVNLFQIEEQTKHYNKQAEKINAYRLHFSPKFRLHIQAIDKASEYFRQLGERCRELGRLMGPGLTSKHFNN